MVREKINLEDIVEGTILVRHSPSGAKDYFAVAESGIRYTTLGSAQKTAEGKKVRFNGNFIQRGTLAQIKEFLKYPYCHSIYYTPKHSTLPIYEGW